MIEVEDKQGLDAELKKNKKVLVLFHASWCSFCRRFVPVFDESTTNFGGDVMRVLLDDYGNPLWDDYSIGAVPTVILFEEGKVYRRLDGRLSMGLSEKQFKTWIDKLECDK